VFQSPREINNGLRVRVIGWLLDIRVNRVITNGGDHPCIALTQLINVDKDSNVLNGVPAQNLMVLPNTAMSYVR
jgi:hypothetical protein